MVRYDEIESPQSCTYRDTGYKGYAHRYGCGYWRGAIGVRTTPCLSNKIFPLECPLIKKETILETVKPDLEIINEITGKTIPVKHRSSKYDEHKKIEGLWSAQSKLGPAKKYRKKPITITAERILERIEIPTLEGVMTGNPGDWLITGVEGEKYPCSDSVFRATYEPHGRKKCGECRHKDNREDCDETYLMYPFCKFEWDDTDEG